jgi:hypothetical protein
VIRETGRPLKNKGRGNLKRVSYLSIVDNKTVIKESPPRMVGNN